MICGEVIGSEMIFNKMSGRQIHSQCQPRIFNQPFNQPLILLYILTYCHNQCSNFHNTLVKGTKKAQTAFTIPLKMIMVMTMIMKNV